MGNVSRLEMAKLLKRLILFAAELDEIASTTYESIGDGTNNNNASSSPENSDDFVLVPSNLPNVDAQAYDRKWVGNWSEIVHFSIMTMQKFHSISLFRKGIASSNHPTLVHRGRARYQSQSRSLSLRHAKFHDFSRLQK